MIYDVARTVSAAASRGRTWVLPLEVIFGGGPAFDPAVAVALNPVSRSARRSRSVAAMVAASCGGAASARTRGTGVIRMAAVRAVAGGVRATAPGCECGGNRYQQSAQQNADSHTVPTMVGASVASSSHSHSAIPRLVQYRRGLGGGSFSRGGVDPSPTYTRRPERLESGVCAPE
jgi:hypothetical protein